MSKSARYTSRTAEIPCGDADLYTFLTDMQNFREIIPAGLISDWKAGTENCSFRLDKVGKVHIELVEAMPHSMVSYSVDTLVTGKAGIQVMIGFVTGFRSEVYLNMEITMNPLVKMLIGDSAPRYIESLISAIESYKGYDRIRGCNQSP